MVFSFDNASMIHTCSSIMWLFWMRLINDPCIQISFLLWLKKQSYTERVRWNLLLPVQLSILKLSQVIMEDVQSFRCTENFIQLMWNIIRSSSQTESKRLLSLQSECTCMRDLVISLFSWQVHRSVNQLLEFVSKSFKT